MTDRAKLDAILAERRAKKAAEEAAKKAAEAPPTPSFDFDDDLVPAEEYERSEEDREMDRIIAGIGILEAYARWCGKSQPKVKRGSTDGIHVSCPVPGHVDRNPSAWVNIEKNTWFCGACQIGGDAHDIAAYHYGYPVPGYKEGALFHKLRKQMAEDFGYIFYTHPGGVTEIIEPEPEDVKSDTTDKSDKADTSDTPPPVLSIVPSEPTIIATDSSDDATEARVFELWSDESDEIDIPSLDWRSILPEDTFLRTYMNCTIPDLLTEEFHFWNAMVALGFALGRDAGIAGNPPIYGNLFVCILADTGSGKTRSQIHLRNLMKIVLPYDHEDEKNKGVKRVNSPGSGEVLIQHFMKPVYDPANPKRIAYYAPVKGLITYSELSGLAARRSRVGSSIDQTLIDLHDGFMEVESSAITTGVKIAEDVFASAITSTQPRALNELVQRRDVDSGFINRWVFVTGPEKQRPAIDKVIVDITPAIKPLERIKGWAGVLASTGEHITWHPEAEAMMDDFYIHTIRPAQKIGGDLFARLDLLMKKIALLLSANKLEKEISPQTMTEAISMYDYLMRCYGIPSAQIGNTLQYEISEAILNFARKQFERDKGAVTLRQINRALSRRKYPNDLLLKCCDNLVKLGQLEILPTRKGSVGRPTVRYQYVP